MCTWYKSDWDQKMNRVKVRNLRPDEKYSGLMQILLLTSEGLLISNN